MIETAEEKDQTIKRLRIEREVLLDKIATLQGYERDQPFKPVTEADKEISGSILAMLERQRRYDDIINYEPPERLGDTELNAENFKRWYAAIVSFVRRFFMSASAKAAAKQAEHERELEEAAKVKDRCVSCKGIKLELFYIDGVLREKYPCLMCNGTGKAKHDPHEACNHPH